MGDDGVLVEELNSIITSCSRHGHRVEVAKLVDTFLTHFLSFDESSRHLEGPSGKYKRVGFVSLPLLEVCNGVLAGSGERYLVFSLLVDFARNKQTGQLHSLLTDENR